MDNAEMYPSYVWDVTITAVLEKLAAVTSGSQTEGVFCTVCDSRRFVDAGSLL